MPRTCAQPDRKGEAAPLGSACPLISVVVPVRNEAGTIEKLLRELVRQDYDPARFEIIVVDGQSTDSTREIVQHLQQQHANLKLLDNPKRWASAGRNQGIRAATGEILLIVDGHCEVGTPEYLTQLADVFSRSGADCVGRPQPLDMEGAAPLQRAIAAARASWLGHHPDSYIYSSTEQFVRPQSVAVAYRRSVIETVGLFDEEFDACEDVEFNNRVERAGFRCFFSPRVRVRYHPRTSLGGLFRQMTRYGRGRMRLLRKHPETFTLACFLPSILVLGVLIGPLVAWFSLWLAAGYVTALGSYSLIVLVISGAIAWTARDHRLAPWLPFIFVAIHFGAGTGILDEWIRGWWRRPASAPVMLPGPP